jgi:DNA polymerase-1
LIGSQYYLVSLYPLGVTPGRTDSSVFQVHDEVILEGPTESADLAKSIVVECMSKPFYGTNILNVELAVDAKCAQNWYAAK